MNYSKDVAIDINQLENEWLKQPSLIMEYYEALVFADDKKSSISNRIDILSGELDSEARTVLAEKGKFTEAMVKAYIAQNYKRTELINLFNAASKEYAILKGAISALEHKKKALENLVQLWMSGYFSQPSEKRQFGVSTKQEIKDKILNNVHQSQRNAINKK